MRLETFIRQRTLGTNLPPLSTTSATGKPRVTNVELGETTAVEYDPASNKKKEIRQDGTFRTWDYDSMNRLWHAYDWRTNVTPTPNQTTIYDRDHAGNARFITDTKGAIYSFVYDQLNRKESATNPSDNTIPPRTESWRYDIAGNLDTYTNPANQQRHFHYDARNRQDRSWWDGGVGVGQDIVTGYDDASRVTSVVTKNGETPITTLALGYDEANRKIWEEQTLAGQPTHRVKTDLDPDGKRLNLQIIPGPHEGLDVYYEPEMQGGGLYLVNYEYTARNQLKKSYGENWEFNYSYDPSGNMTTRQSVYNGVSSSTNCPNDDYDALNRPRTWEQTGPNGFHALSHYKYDQGKPGSGELARGRQQPRRPLHLRADQSGGQRGLPWPCRQRASIRRQPNRDLRLYRRQIESRQHV